MVGSGFLKSWCLDNYLNTRFIITRSGSKIPFRSLFSNTNLFLGRGFSEGLILGRHLKKQNMPLHLTISLTSQALLVLVIPKYKILNTISVFLHLERKTRQIKKGKCNNGTLFIKWVGDEKTCWLTFVVRKKLIRL